MGELLSRMSIGAKLGLLTGVLLSAALTVGAGRAAAAIADDDDWQEF